MKKFLIFLLLAGVVFGAYQYISAPLFWSRYIASLTSSGAGASSPVFDYRATVPGADAPIDIPTATPSLLPAETKEQLIEYAKAFDSFALLVVHKGELQFEWYREDYNRASLTQSQSLHKGLQALLVGIALEKGLIQSLDDPVSRYLPQLDVDGKRDATIRHYLQMSTGLEPFSGGFGPFGDAFRWLYSPDIAAATFDIPQGVAPGTEFDYHDANSQTLGILLSTVFERPYVEYLQEYLWAPIGAGPADAWLDNEGGIAHHNCCLLATAMDWAKVGLLVLNQGRVGNDNVIGDSWVRQQTSPALTPHYGFQTWIASNAEPNPRQGGGGYRRNEKWLAGDVVYFSGYGAQRVYISRERDLVIVRLGPAAGYFPDIEESWDNTFLVNTVVRALDGR